MEMVLILLTDLRRFEHPKIRSVLLNSDGAKPFRQLGQARMDWSDSLAPKWERLAENPHIPGLSCQLRSI